MEFEDQLNFVVSEKTGLNADSSTGNLPSAEKTLVEIRVEIQRIALSLSTGTGADPLHGHGQLTPERRYGSSQTPVTDKLSGTMVSRDSIIRNPSEPQHLITQERLGGFKNEVDQHAGLPHSRARELHTIIDRTVTKLINREVVTERAEHPHHNQAKEPPSANKPATKEASHESRVTEQQAPVVPPQLHIRGESSQRTDSTKAPEISNNQELNREFTQNGPRVSALEPARDPSATPITSWLQQPPTIDTPRPQVTLSMPLEEARMIALDKISTLREALQIAPYNAEHRSSTIPQPTGEIKTIEHSVQDATPRATDQQRLPDLQREISTPAFTIAASAPTEQKVAPQQSTEPTSRSTITPQEHQQANQILSGLEKITSQLISLNALRTIDRALETVCLSVVAGGYLGAQGAAYIFRETLTATVDIIARLREMLGIPSTLTAELSTVQESLDQLEKQCLDRDFEKVTSAAGFVGDIIGQIKLSGSGLPVEGITVDGGSLGTCITNSLGEFRFDNIPLDTGYEITAHDARYLFFPSSFVGTVATTNQLTFSATKA